jgi:uncharacterized protein (TIGR00730 family)
MQGEAADRDLCYNSCMRICVFCGSAAGWRTEHVDAARELGKALAGRGIGLVNGGGRVGLMGATADGALEAGGEAIGVIPRALMDRELGHEGMTQLRVVESMHDRKALMAELSDGFVALPGGIGTFEELLEIATWAQLGIHRKPIGVLNVAGYYDPLAALLDHAARERFVSDENRRLVVFERDPRALIERLAVHEPPRAPAWITAEEA